MLNRISTRILESILNKQEKRKLGLKNRTTTLVLAFNSPTGTPQVHTNKDNRLATGTQAGIQETDQQPTITTEEELHQLKTAPEDD